MRRLLERYANIFWFHCGAGWLYYWRFWRVYFTSSEEGKDSWRNINCRDGCQQLYFPARAQRLVSGSQAWLHAAPRSPEDSPRIRVHALADCVSVLKDASKNTSNLWPLLWQADLCSITPPLLRFFWRKRVFLSWSVSISDFWVGALVFHLYPISSHPLISKGKLETNASKPRAVGLTISYFFFHLHQVQKSVTRQLLWCYY